MRHQEIADVERAILGPCSAALVPRRVHGIVLDGDYGPLEGLLAKPGLLGSQSQKAFLYMCFRQQFLEHIDNRALRHSYVHVST